MYVPHERRAVILRLLEQRGYLRSAELAEELGVTEETIRTDLIALQERKLLKRVHGGARFIPPTGGEEDATRLDSQLIERILPHLSPGMQVYIDTTPLMHTLLGSMGSLPCSLLTPSPRHLLMLTAKAMPQQALAPGGMLDKECGLMSSEHAEAFFTRHRPDVALLSPPSILTPQQIAYHHATQAAWAAAAARAARRVIIAAPAHALYTQAVHSISCPLHFLITEDHVPAEFGALPSELIPYLSVADLQQESL